MNNRLAKNKPNVRKNPANARAGLPMIAPTKNISKDARKRITRTV